MVLAFEAAGPIQATVWHMRRGSTVAFDGHRFHLPLSWYPDPDSNPGQLTLRQSQLGGPSVSSITVAKRPQTLDDHAALDRIAAMTANLNAHEPPTSDRWTIETLRGRSLTFRCTMSTTAGASESLICQAAGSNLTVFALTVGRSARTQALDIIETSE